MNCGKVNLGVKPYFTRHRHQLLVSLEVVDKYVIHIIFFFFHKIADAGHLDNRKSLSIAFLVISDHYATFFSFTFFYKIAEAGHFG